FFDSAVGGTVEYNTIDGNHTSGSLNSLIFCQKYGDSGGTYTIKYNWLKNAVDDGIDAGASIHSSNTIYDVENNVLENIGSGNDVNAHPDWLQTFADGQYTRIAFDYNTIIQTAVSPSGVQGITLDGNGNTPLATFHGGDVSYNTVVTTSQPAGALGYFIRIALNETDGTW